METTRDPSGGVLKIAGKLDIGVAAELLVALREYVGAAATPALDLSAVEACDTTAFQLLCSARRTAEGAGKPFKIVGLPDTVRSAAAELGLDLLGAATGRGDGDAQ